MRTSLHVLMTAEEEEEEVRSGANLQSARPICTVKMCAKLNGGQGVLHCSPPARIHTGLQSRCWAHLLVTSGHQRDIGV